MRAGSRNDITDVGGVAVGHHQRAGRRWLTGTTVVLPPLGTTGGVDVRGGGPGTRDTDALAPTNMVSRVDAVCLSGGSAYGLESAGGVMAWLEAHQRGFRIGPQVHHVVPIVPTAVVFDLGAGGDFTARPDAEFGYKAAANARPRPVAQGTVGAGTGSHAGALKGGVGSASVVTDEGITIGALVVVNCGGSPVDLATGELLGARNGLPGEFTHLRRPAPADRSALAELRLGPTPLNTTLAVVATDASLSKPECTRVAGAGHDGMARAISPVHQYTDGDVVFVLATGTRELPEGDSRGFIQPESTRFVELGTIIAAVADVVTRAIVHGVLAATSAGGMRSYTDQFPSALRAPRSAATASTRSAKRPRSGTAGSAPP